MARVLDGELRGVYEDRCATAAGYLREWLAAKKAELAPTTYAGYEACVERDLIRTLDDRMQSHSWNRLRTRAARAPPLPLDTIHIHPPETHCPPARSSGTKTRLPSGD
ncbi:hypothetical protein [Kitasatospora acidiphila]